MALSVQSRQVGDITVLTCRGRIAEGGESAQLETQVADLLPHGPWIVLNMTATPPRWQDPMRWAYKGYEIVQPAPPERQGLFCNLVLGMLNHLDITKLGHYTESAESLYYFAHALRRAEFELGLLSDPEQFGVPMETWTSDAFHAHLASILKNSRPKPGTDLTRHVEYTSYRSNLQAFGWAASATSAAVRQPAGSCELTCVDEQGNWVQMMDTLQSGGIAGIAVDGVPMCGSHCTFDTQAAISGWLGVPGNRMRSVMTRTDVTGPAWLNRSSSVRSSVENGRLPT